MDIPSRVRVVEDINIRAILFDVLSGVENRCKACSNLMKKQINLGPIGKRLLNRGGKLTLHLIIGNAVDNTISIQ